MFSLSQTQNPKKIDGISQSRLYKYLEDPVHSINFAASKIRYDINRWASEIDVSSRMDILGTLYSRGEIDIHDNPDSNDRGKQIDREFYPIAQEIFSE